MSAHESPPKRPRLSLQIRALAVGPGVRTSRTLAAVVDPKSPTAFNTLSNVYSTAIDRSTPIQMEPVTAINTRGGQPPLRLQTQHVAKEWRDPTPYTAHYPDTPLTAQPLSPAVAMELNFPSTMTATPPLSAGPVDPSMSAVFSFSPKETLRPPPGTALSTSPRTPRRRTTFPTGSSGRSLPYNHPRSLHSILRNSPLPPRSAQSPISPRRQSLRLAEKAARRVGYESPLTQTITTNRYTKSHIDLLFEEASPYSPSNPREALEGALDLTMAYTGDETRDGGQTPGPFEEMRRRMAGLVTETPISAPASASSSGGIRKRKRKEKKRRWVWTIGPEDGDDDIGGALAAIKAARVSSSQTEVTVSAPALSPPRPTKPAKPAKPPPALSVNVLAAIAETSAPDIITPSIETADASLDSMLDASGDIEMSDTCSVVSELTDRALTPWDMDLDMTTPTVTRKGPRESSIRRRLGSSRLGSEDLINPETGLRRDTPIPADLLVQ